MAYADETWLDVKRPANDYVAITPADVDLTRPIRALYVGGDGNVKLTSLNDSVVIFTGMVAGMIYPVMAKRVWAADTSATGLVGLY